MIHCIARLFLVIKHVVPLFLARFTTTFESKKALAAISTASPPKLSPCSTAARTSFFHFGPEDPYVPQKNVKVKEIWALF